MGHVNIRKYAAESESRLIQRIPKFALKIIERIVHQKELNEIIDGYAEYKGIDFLPKAVEHLGVKFEIEGEENLPESGRCIFAANHPFGLLDGMGITYIISRKYGDLRSIGNDVFEFVPNLNPIMVNVNVFGTNTRQNIIELNKVYASDLPITHFPYGLVSRMYKYRVRDKEWKKSFIKKAISHKRDIVPIRFYGRNSLLFYSIFLFRKIFRIKVNLELMLLPHEMFRKRGKTIKVKIFPPVSHQDLDRSKTHVEWAQHIRSIVYEDI